VNVEWHLAGILMRWTDPSLAVNICTVVLAMKLVAARSNWNSTEYKPLPLEFPAQLAVMFSFVI
jgi:hypothetical protein